MKGLKLFVCVCVWNERKIEKWVIKFNGLSGDSKQKKIENTHIKSLPKMRRKEKIWTNQCILNKQNWQLSILITQTLFLVAISYIYITILNNQSHQCNYYSLSIVKMKNRYNICPIIYTQQYTVHHFVVIINCLWFMWLIYPCFSGLFHWHWSNHGHRAKEVLLKGMRKILHGWNKPQKY